MGWVGWDETLRHRHEEMPKLSRENVGRIWRCSRTPSIGRRTAVDDRGTPPELFDPLMERFGFTLDVAAAAHNAKCPRWYGIEANGLEQPWRGRVWCNPPYSNLWAWCDKAWREWRAGQVECIAMLLPANRTEQAWWQDHIEPALRRRSAIFAVEFLRGRQRFIMPGQTEVLPNQRPPFGVCLAIWEVPS